MHAILLQHHGWVRLEAGCSAQKRFNLYSSMISPHSLLIPTAYNCCHLPQSRRRSGVLQLLLGMCLCLAFFENVLDAFLMGEFHFNCDFRFQLISFSSIEFILLQLFTLGQ